MKWFKSSLTHKAAPWLTLGRPQWGARRALYTSLNSLKEKVANQEIKNVAPIPGMMGILV